MSGYNLPEGIYRNPYDDDTIICSICGEEIDEDDYENVGDKFVCNSCLSYEYTKCTECHKYVKNDELKEINEHQLLCEDCFIDKGYTICNVCGKLEQHQEDIYYPYVCKECNLDLKHLDKELK